MALKSTVYKVALNIADMNRQYYQTHQLTIARHPSETDERMMVRLLAFALHADEQLAFGEGICDEAQADLWLHDLSGVLRLWIDVGTPDEKLLRKACNRADNVVVYAYGGRTVDIWFQQNKALLEKQDNLQIYNLAADTTKALAAMAQRNMDVQCTIQDDQLWLSDADNNVEITPQLLLGLCPQILRALK